MEEKDKKVVTEEEKLMVLRQMEFYAQRMYLEQFSLIKNVGI